MSTVVITGAAGGLGSATADAFIAAGHHVYGIDRKQMPSRESFTAVESDLSDVAAVREVLQNIGPVHHLVSVAGGALAAEKVITDIGALTIDVFRASIEQNLMSAFVTLQAVLPLIRSAEGDRSISLTTSTDAMVSYGLPAYAAAKSGIIGIVHSLAGTLGSEGIRINAVAPGDIPTARNQAEWAHKGEWYADLAAGNPLGRLCTPEEIAETFLALSDKLTGITGQVLVVDAGLVGGQLAVKPSIRRK